MADRSDIIYAKAVLDFDKEHSIRTVKNITKEAERVLKRFKNNKDLKLKLLDNDGIQKFYGTVIKHNNKYKELQFTSINDKQMFFDKKQNTDISDKRLKSVYGIDKSKLEKATKEYSKLYDKAEKFNNLVKSFQEDIAGGNLVSLKEVENIKSVYEKIRPEFNNWDEIAQGIDKGAKALDDYVANYQKLVSKKNAEEFNDIVKSLQDFAKDGNLISLSEIRDALSMYEKFRPNIEGEGKLTDNADKNATFLEEYISNYTSASKKLNQIINESLSPMEKQKLKISALKKELSDLEHEFIALSMAGEPVSDLEARIKGLRKEINKLEEKLKPTQIQKLFKTIKRVGFYRVARNLFKIIEHGFMDGINDLVAFDNRANETFSSIAKSFDLIRSSTALMVMPLAGVVAPMFEQIAYSVVDFAENISRASSALNNMSEYTRVNKEYMKDLREEANKTTTSFDKFESLNAKNNPFEVATMTQEEMDEAKISSTASALQIITHTLEILWTFLKEIARELKDIWNAIEPRLEPFLNVLRTFIGIIGDIFVWIFKVVATVGKWASENGILEEAIWGVIFVIAGLKLAGLIANISSIITKLRTTKVSAMETSLALNKVTQSTSALSIALKTASAIGIGFFAYKFFDAILEKAPSAIKALVGIATAIMAIAGAIALVKTHGNPIALATFAIGVGGVIATVKNMTSEIPQYANGGLVDSGSLFIAGEAGAELVTTMPSGQTGVTNIAQFKQAMVEAIYECSDVFQQSGESVVLNLDGAEIARSKSFKSELNRTNPRLNLR